MASGLLKKQDIVFLTVSTPTPVKRLAKRQKTARTQPVFTRICRAKHTPLGREILPETELISICGIITKSASMVRRKTRSIPTTLLHRRKWKQQKRLIKSPAVQSNRTVRLLILGEDDEPGGIGAASAGQNHVAAGLQCLTFLNQHFAFAKQADRNSAILSVGDLDF